MIFCHFNIVPFNRNELGPVILQSLYAIEEEFLILVLQPPTRGADNIIVVRKFPSFHEFFYSLKTDRSHFRAKSAKTMGGEAVQNRQFGWQSELAMMYELVMTWHTVSQLSSSLLFQCRWTFSNQISVVCSCNSCAMFQIVSQYTSFRIPEYSGHDFAG